MKYILLFVSILTIVSGCTRFNDTPVEPLLGRDINLVTLGYEIADDLIEGSLQSIVPGDPQKPILTVTFVNNDDLNKTSPFGRSLQNSVSSRFVQQGFAVKEVKLRNNLFIRKQTGEFMLSRNLTLINEHQHAQGVVVGTYSVMGNIMYLSTRLVNPISRTVLATYDQRIHLDTNSLRMLGLGGIKDPNIDEIKPPKKSFLNRFLF